jgi:hypothetical protein
MPSLTVSRTKVPAWVFLVWAPACLAQEAASDPNQEFMRLSGGRPVWSREDATQAWMVAAFDDVARQIGVTNGRITREQYLAYVRRLAAEDGPGDHVDFQVQIDINRPAPRGLLEWEQSPAGRGDAVPLPLAPAAGPAAAPRPELPAWFTQCDSNRDGQVSLYEWRKAGRPLDEFRRMDRNNDGLLTPEEVFWYLRTRGARPAAAR